MFRWPPNLELHGQLHVLVPQIPLTENVSERLFKKMTEIGMGEVQGALNQE